MQYKVLITNSVAVNGGDEALLMTTIEAIKAKLPNCSFTVLSNMPALCEQYIPGISFKKDWEYVFLQYQDTFWGKMKRKVRRQLHQRIKVNYYSVFSQIFASSEERKIYRLYKNADIIISSPGGYIHDFYDYGGRTLGYELCRYLKKKFIFLAQSLGPFWKPDQYTRILPVLNNADAILLREELSKNYLDHIGVKNKNILITTDMAFAHHKLYPAFFKKKSNRSIKKVVLAFRSWRNEENDNEIKEKARKLILALITQYDADITFVSTCQGISEYIDDSNFAKDICLGFSDDILNKIFIDEKKYSLGNLIEKYATFDAYIGMRLHGAILAMMGGTPAFNIAYEDKTAGIFSFLEMDENFIHFSKEYETWQKSIDHFFSNYNTNLKKLKAIIDRASEVSIQNADIVTRIIRNG